VLEPQLIQDPAPAATHERRPAWLVVALQAVVVLLVFAAVGAVAGVVWERLWTPPTGLVYHHRWFPDENGVRGMFSGTGWYVVVAVVAGAIAGLAAALLLARSELATLAAVVVGSLVGGWVMWQVGTALGPPDAAKAAASLPDYRHVVGSLRTSGDSYRIAFPTGALLGAGAIFLGFSGKRRART
jgi:hypothetical protein